MKTTEITVNAECPGCGKPCPPKLGIPGSHQHGWEWDARTEQRWCRSCHETLEAKRHFEARGWVWKITHHDIEGDRVKYVDELTDWHETNEMWGRLTVTIMFDPDRVVLPPEDVEEFQERVEEMADAIDANGPDLPRYVVIPNPDEADALREELNPES